MDRWQRCFGWGLIALVVIGNAGDVQGRIDQGRQKLKTSVQAAFAYAKQLRSEAGSATSDQSAIISAVADWVSAAAYVKSNRPAVALEFSSHGLAQVHRIAPNSFLHGELLLEQANSFSLQGHIQQALKAYQAAYHVFVASKSSNGQAIALLDIAASFCDGGDDTTCLRYSRQAAQLPVTDNALKLAAFNNAALALTGLNRLEEAQHYYREALALATANRSTLYQIQILDNLARLQLDLGELPRAEDSLKIASTLVTRGAAVTWHPIITATTAQLLLQKGEAAKAAHLIGMALASGASSQANAQLINLHKTAYQVYKAVGDTDRSLHELEQFKRVDDQARVLSATTGAALIAARFDFANQDLKISRLRAGQAERDAALARSQARFHTALLAALSIISGLLAAGIFFLGRSRNEVRAANRSLQGTNAELERALAAKGEFLSTTSHEIRTPLNGILGMTQVLLADRGVPVGVRDRVELIHGAGETMRALVDDILDMAKMETGELRLHPAPMDLRRLLEQAGAVWSGQAETKRLRLHLDLDRCPHGIVADEVRLRQVVFNLMSNAIKFTDRGQVGLTAWTEPRGDGEAVLLCIEDSGIGIPADRLAEIFESFRQVDGGVTRRHGGTGLGLAICRNIARAMGGDVGVDSVPGVGSRFTVDLPLERTSVEATAAEVAAVAPAATLADARLLLLEPNPLSQGILRALVTPQVAALEAAADRADAAALLATGGFHHLLADGAAFGSDAAAAAAFVAAQPVARTTLTWAQPDEAVRAALAAAGVQLVAKPVSPADLLAALRIGYDDPLVDRDIAA